MKKTILLLACVATSRLCFAQEIPKDSNAILSAKEEYLQKARNKKSGAITMVVIGGILVIVAGAVSASDAKHDLENIDIFNPPPESETNKHETVSTVLAVTGLAVILGSIGLFVSAHKNKKKAMSIGFKNEQAMQVQQSMVFYRSIPSLSLKISL